MKRASLMLLLFLTACATPPLKEAAEKGLLHKEIKAESFSLLALVRDTHSMDPFVIYIEGDGQAWLDRHTPSTDPTPHKAMALQLALLDPSENLAYLARPCQYISSESCETSYWTTKRFAPEIVTAMNHAVSTLADGRKIHLVGYSGGGAIAALIAAQRKDVLSLSTIAGNLDTRRFTAYHDVSPLDGSLNPADAAKALRKLPQIHLVGKKDTVVPEEILLSFLKAMGRGLCTKIMPVEEAHHENGWENAWQTVLETRPLVSCGPFVTVER